MKPNFKHDKHMNLNFSKPLMLSCGVIVCAIVCGALIFSLNTKFISQEISSFFVAFTTEFSYKSFLEIFCGDLLPSLIFYAFAVVFGTCALGAVPVILTFFTQFFGLGALAAFLFGSYGLEGVEYFLLIFLPAKSVLIFSAIILFECTVSASQTVKRTVFGKEKDPFHEKDYWFKCLFALFFVVISSLLEALMIRLFSSLFSFC